MQDKCNNGIKLDVSAVIWSSSTTTTCAIYFYQSGNISFIVDTLLVINFVCMIVRKSKVNQYAYSKIWMIICLEVFTLHYKGLLLLYAKVFFPTYLESNITVEAIIKIQVALVFLFFYNFITVSFLIVELLFKSNLK